MASKADVEFKTGDNVTLRGWFFSSSTGGSEKLPTLILSHGFSAIKEMDLDKFAEHFSSSLPMHCLVYDQRGFGASDTAPGQPRYEIIPSIQHSDLQDAITYAQTRPDVDPDKVGIWGSSYSGANVLYVGAVDKRVKCVMSQVPLVNGYANFRALVRCDMQPGLDKLFEQDRITRSQGKDAMTIPVVHENPLETSALPTADSYKFFTKYEGDQYTWKNTVTLRSMEYLRAYAPAVHVQEISPAPLLMTVAEKDVLTPTKLALDVYGQALEPKRLNILKGAGHFDGYSGDWWDRNISVQTEFLKENFC